MNHNPKAMALSIVHLILMIGALGLSCISLFTYDLSAQGTPLVLSKIWNIAAIFASVFGFAYFFAGYRKSAAVLYRIFLALFTLVLVLENISAMVSSETPLLYSIVLALTPVIAVVLVVAKDLGERKSSLLGGAMVLLRLVAVIVAFVQPQPGLSAAAATGMQLQLLAALLLCACAGLMVAAKYYNKNLRGAAV